MNEETRQKLLSAVLKGQTWLRRFTITEYADAFQHYKEQFGPVYVEAVRSTQDLPTLAANLLDGMEADWTRRWPWNRTAARMDVLQMLVDYLSPLLLDLEPEEPACRQLAECIRDGWNAKRPKEAYKIATYQRVKSGFRRTILGIPLPDKRSEPEE